MNQLRNRAAVKVRLIEVGAYAMTAVELYEDRTEDIPVLHTWDYSPVDTSGLYLGLVTGESEPASIGTRALTEDRWSLDCELAITGCPDSQTAELAAEAALNAFDTVLRRLQRLIDPQDEIPTADPPVSASEPAPWDVAWAHISSVTGPYHPPLRKGTTAHSGCVDFTISGMTDLK